MGLLSREGGARGRIDRPIKCEVKAQAQASPVLAQLSLQVKLAAMPQVVAHPGCSDAAALWCARARVWGGGGRHRRQGAAGAFTPGSGRQADQKEKDGKEDLPPA